MFFVLWISDLDDKSDDSDDEIYKNRIDRHDLRIKNENLSTSRCINIAKSRTKNEIQPIQNISIPVQEIVSNLLTNYLFKDMNQIIIKRKIVTVFEFFRQKNPEKYIYQRELHQVFHQMQKVRFNTR